MMLRKIITSANPTLTLLLPDEMVGKTVEVIAFEINEDKNLLDKEQRIRQIQELTKSTLVDLSRFKFDRDDANNYAE